MPLNKLSLEKKAELVRKKIGLSLEEMKLIQSCAYGLYQGELGGDMPASKKDGTCSRAEIMEVVLDANRLESDMKRHTTPGIEKFFKCDYKMMLDLIGPAFKYERYEVGQPYEVW